MKRIVVFAGFIVSAALAFSAHAQNSSFVIDNQPNYFSVAGGVAPDYTGSDDFKFVAEPAGRIRHAS